MFLNTAGGTFALYSLICRHAKVSLLPNQLPSDARISSFRLKVPSPELERSLKIKERLETSLTLKKLLLILVLAGTSMVIADGVVTPAMSGYLLTLFPYCFVVLLMEDLAINDKTGRKKEVVMSVSVFPPFFFCFVAATSDAIKMKDWTTYYFVSCMLVLFGNEQTMALKPFYNGCGSLSILKCAGTIF